MFANNGLLIANHCDLVQPTKNGTTIAKKAIPATNGKIVKKTPAVNGISRIASSQDSAKKVETNGVEKQSINPRNYDDLVRLAEIIRSMADLQQEPKIGIICGSGLGELADKIQNPRILPFADIPGFPSTTVQGHKGNLVFGHLNDAYVMCLQGRFHPYEHNMDLTLCSMPVRIMHLLGVKTLIISNAAGGVNSKLQYGDLMLIKDHIFMPGLSGFSPLVGLNDPRFGPRFVSVHDAYDKNLRKAALKVADIEGFRIHEGIYVMSGGPQYESPAEVGFYKAVGGDALGMSTCHEVTVARQCGMRVLGFSLITNICNTDADSSVEVSHEEVLQAGKEAGHRACKFVTLILDNMLREDTQELSSEKETGVKLSSEESGIGLDEMDNE
ncbi:phosphorylase superfamily domain-containing protein [Ditylenchus destructor]|uniref:Purine nucleoside phosphorylase n=1 Tax=Ditylenchus destructor TaxID=166010 RepID=A0AAD4N1Q6_9BILA|nr:phosphorylase superfamily domain-containing protein [Ditylenchus destructor]